VKEEQGEEGRREGREEGEQLRKPFLIRVNLGKKISLLACSIDLGRFGSGIRNHGIATFITGCDDDDEASNVGDDEDDDFNDGDDDCSDVDDDQLKGN
jgi:hypothetical protein